MHKAQIYLNNTEHQMDSKKGSTRLVSSNSLSSKPTKIIHTTTGESSSLHTVSLPTHHVPSPRTCKKDQDQKAGGIFQRTNKQGT